MKRDLERLTDGELRNLRRFWQQRRGDIAEHKLRQLRAEAERRDLDSIILDVGELL